MALLPRRFRRRPATRRYARPHLPGETQLSDPKQPQNVDLTLTLQEADALHAALENFLETSSSSPQLEHVYRTLAWRILATRGGTGLTGRMAEIAREAGSVEEYESARDAALGPILDGLERPENRDP